MNHLFFLVFALLSILPLVVAFVIELFGVGVVAMLLVGVPAGSFDTSFDANFRLMLQLGPVINSMLWLLAPLLLATSIAAFIPISFDDKRDLLFKLQKELLWNYLKFKIPGACILAAVAICLKMEGFVLVFLASLLSIAIASKLTLKVLDLSGLVYKTLPEKPQD